MVSELERKRICICGAVDNIAPELQREIKEKKSISIPSKDLAKKMGAEFEKEPRTKVYWMIKYCLFDKGIIVNTKKIDHEDTLLMRAKVPGDVMPETLKRYYERKSKKC